MKKMMIAIAALAALTGCAAGYEVGAKVGMYKIDEQRIDESRRSRSTPIRCLFVNCEQPAQEAYAK